MTSLVDLVEPLIFVRLERRPPYTATTFDRLETGSGTALSMNVPLPERARVWGGLNFGLDAGDRTDLVDMMSLFSVAKNDFRDDRREFERRYIARCLEESSGNVTKAASVLGMHRQSLQHKLRELGLGRRYVAVGAEKE